MTTLAASHISQGRSPANAGPLRGMRVIDLTSVIMGPYGTRILGDMAADVSKVESPEGDSFRAYGPFRHTCMGGSMLNLHRNKRSIYLDLKQGSGQEALKRLIQSAEALVHNLRPAAAQRLGLDWKCPCSRPQSTSCWWSISVLVPSSRLWAGWALRASFRPIASPNARWTEGCASCLTRMATGVISLASLVAPNWLRTRASAMLRNASSTSISFTNWSSNMPPGKAQTAGCPCSNSNSSSTTRMSWPSG